jgi:putative membrane protein
VPPLAQVLLVGHLLALVFGLAGLLVAIPNPDLWADSSFGPKAYDFGMSYAGSLHIVCAAAAMFVYGAATIGYAKTTVFFVAATSISLGSELIGTNTGEPFGNYAYTSFLGYKVLDHVPFSIPLSWFYMGFASYLLSHAVARLAGVKPVGPYAIVGCAWLITVWDLVLDPAMAHESLAVKFWIWDETGPYFGMPLQNFAGWTLTALVFATVARLAWMSDPAIEAGDRHLWFPLVIYIANVVFASALSAYAELWLPIMFAVLLGVIPASIALVRGRTR